MNYVGECGVDSYLCGECEGNCNGDSSCEGNLLCGKRDEFEDVLGCSGAGGGRDLKGTSICYLPTAPPGVVNYVGECSVDGFLCGLCEGDCDGDSTCEGNLVCMNRDGFEDVPGCTGAGGASDRSGKDICMVDPTSSPTPSPSASPIAANVVRKVGNPCTDYFDDGLCEVCTGDCDVDSDCAEGLRCGQRNAGDVVPGCSFMDGYSDQSSATDYCE